MKNILIAITVFSFSTFTLLAQNYKKIVYKSQTIENNEEKVTISDANSTAAGIKFKIRILNKTNDYLIYKPSESSFVIAGKESNPNEKWLIIRPNEEEWKVIDLKGSQFLVAADYVFKLNGIYRVPMNAEGIKTPDFQVPPSVNEFKAGGFTCTIGKIKKETARTDVQFKTNYNGDKIGIFEPNKVAMKMPDGKEYANFHSDKDPLIFAKGDNETFVVAWKDIPSSSGDMQKVDLQILWRDAFKEVTPNAVPLLSIDILFDEETTKTKNK